MEVSVSQNQQTMKYEQTLRVSGPHGGANSDGGP